MKRKIFLILIISLLATVALFAFTGCSNSNKDLLQDVEFNDVSLVYNGKEQAVEVLNLPDGVSVDYYTNTGINVGEYNATAILSDGKNTKVLKAKLTIEKKELIVVANNVEYDLGVSEEDMTFSYSINGFVDGEDQSVITKLPELEPINDFSEGNHDILFKGAKAQNYKFSYESGTLSIVDKTFSSVVFEDSVIAYDGQEHTILAEKPSDINVEYENDGPFKDVGEYTITARLSFGSSYKELTAKLTINKKEVTVIAVDVTYYKGTSASDMKFSYKLSGLADGETEDVFEKKPELSPITDNSVGQYTIKYDGAKASNYSFKYIDGILSIKEPYEFIENGKYLLYGRYPQTAVTDSEFIAELKNAIELGYAIYNSDTGWYDYNGNSYAKLKAKLHDADISCKVFAGGTKIKNGDEYFFKVEDIKWRVLESQNGSKLVMSDMLIDSVQFNYTHLDVTVDGVVHKANDWNYSTIRTWLNGDFKSNITSCLYENYIQTNGNGDDVFFASYEQVTNVAYGFEAKAGKSESRIAYATDYAIAKGAYLPINNQGYWWLSDANIAEGNLSNNQSVAVVSYDGYASLGEVSAQYYESTNSTCCIRPCIYFSEV